MNETTPSFTLRFPGAWLPITDIGRTMGVGLEYGLHVADHSHIDTQKYLEAQTLATRLAAHFGVLRKCIFWRCCMWPYQ